MINNYIFDFDGTIADSSQCGILATQAAFEQGGYPVPCEERIHYFTGIPIEQSFKEMLQTRVSDQAFEELLGSFRTHYRALEESTLQAFPLMNEVLHQLTLESKQCFVVSSKKTDVLKRNLTMLGLDSFFKDCIGSDQVKHYKPHPEGVQLLMERYSLNKEETVVIGDSIFDILMGKSAGCFTCGVTWGCHSKEMLLAEEPTFLIDQITHLNTLRP